MGYSSKARGSLCTRKAKESKCTNQAKQSQSKQRKAKQRKVNDQLSHMKTFNLIKNTHKVCVMVITLLHQMQPFSFHNYWCYQEHE